MDSTSSAAWPLAVLVLLVLGCGKAAPTAAPSSSPPGEAAAPEPTAPAPDAWVVFGVTRQDKTPWLTLYAKRRDDSDIVAKLSQGTRVRLIETRDTWRRVSVTDGEHLNASGWVDVCCLRPRAASDLYRARLGPEDHTNSKGIPINHARGILRQDRANYHKLTIRDDDDQHDDTFGDAEARAWLSEVAQTSLDKSTADLIRGHEPLIEVIVYEDRIALTVVDKGPPHQVSREGAVALCQAQHCACLKGRGDCRDEGYSRCMSGLSHRTTGGCRGAGP